MKKFIAFLDIKFSLPHSQVPAIYPYPEPYQSNPCLPSYFFLEIRFNIILSSKPRSYKWSLSIRSPNQNLVCTPLVFSTCHIPRPSHSTLFVYPNNQTVPRYRKLKGLVRVSKRLDFFILSRDTEKWCLTTALDRSLLIFAGGCT